MSSYFDVIAAVAAAAGVVLFLNSLHRRLADTRPGFDVSTALLVGLAARTVSIVALTVAPEVGGRIRGTDEAAFLNQADALMDLPLDDARWRDVLSGDVAVLPLVMLRVLSGEVPVVAARFVQAGLALTGILLLAAAGYHLAGPRGSRIFAWIAALEPAGVFFSTLLHDEALVLLGEALVILGIVKWWRQARMPAGILIVAGLAVLVAARPYLGGASALACLGALAFLEAARRIGALRAVASIAVASLLAVVVALVALPDVAPGQLQSLQAQHDYEYVGYRNLDLPPVEVRTTSGLASTLWERTGDYVLRPFPWQVENLSQRLGALGTVAWYGLAVAALTAFVLAARSRDFVVRVVPILLLALAQSGAYALVLVNAGLGFRHRMHLALMVALVLVVAGSFIASDARWPRTLKRRPRGAVAQSWRRS